MEEEIKQVETISVPEIPVQLPKKSNLPKVVPLFILGLIILAGAVYAGITIGKKQSPPEVIPQVTETSPTPDETANWKIYSNEELGFSFKYPAELKYSYDYMNNAVGRGTGQISIQNYDGLKPTEVQDSLKTQFHLTVNKEPVLSLQEYVGNQQNLLEQDYKNKKFIPISQVNVGGKQALKGETILKGEKVPTVWLEHNKFIYIVVMSPATLPNTQIFDQILSTFKFLDQKTDEIANWKTYTNKKYLYIVKYPTEWYLQEARDLTNTIISNFSLTSSRPGYEFNPGDIKIEIYSNTPEFISVPTNGVQITTFAGNKATQITEENTTAVPNNVNVTMKIKRIYVDKEASRYGMAIYLANSTLEQEKLVDQILSTFKFLD